MENFNIKKYLNEGRLLKEELIDFDGNDMYQEIQRDMKDYYGRDVSMDIIKGWADNYFPSNYGKGEYEFETSAREDFLTYLQDDETDETEDDRTRDKIIDQYTKTNRIDTPRNRRLAKEMGLSLDDYFNLP